MKLFLKVLYEYDKKYNYDAYNFIISLGLAWWDITYI